jgi:hypothetical protein
MNDTVTCYIDPESCSGDSNVLTPCNPGLSCVEVGVVSSGGYFECLCPAGQMCRDINGGNCSSVEPNSLMVGTQQCHDCPVGTYGVRCN